MSNKLELSGIQQNVIRELGSLFTVNRWGSPVKGGVAKTYREMNAAASEIAFKEAKVYFLAYSKERTFARLKAGIRARAKTKEKKSVEEDQESKLATTVFLDYFNQRKAHHMTPLEVNTLPGMTPTSLFPDGAAAMGLDFPALTDRLVRSAAARGVQPD